MASEYRGIEVFGRRPRTTRTPVLQRRPRNLLGVLALCAALFTVVVTVVGIFSAETQRYEVATWLAYLATGTSAVAVLCGAAAVVTGRGRGWGGVAVLIGALASPPILTQLLGWASGLG
jgi:hypothetical membrane protein